MRRLRHGRLLTTIVVVAMCTVFVAPMGAIAAGPTAPPDAYEAGAGDDTPATASSLNGRFTGAGDAPYTQQHTLDEAQAANPGHDEDWFYFDVSAQNVAAEYHYILEAIPMDDPDVDPVIEVFGPTTAGTITYSHAHNFPPLSLDPSGDLAVGSIEGGWQSYWTQTTNNGASVDFYPAAAGRYFVRVRPYASNVGAFYGDTAGSYEFRAKVSAFSRLWGANRIETAVAISAERFPDGMLGAPMADNLSTAIVASGYNFPDALAAASLAGIVQGPILLVEQNALPAATSDELLRLDPDRVVIVGGPAAVSAGVRVAIQNAFAGAGNPVTVDRVSGADRIETSVEIGDEMKALASTVPTATPGFAFLVNGYNFPDALSCSPMAAGNAVPILLSDGTSLRPEVLAFIANHAITDVVIVGGPAVISASVEAQLRTLLGNTRVLRLAGADRFETSKVFATWATDLPAPGMTGRVGTAGNPEALLGALPWQIGVATGENFPDALSAGPFCGADWFGRPKPLLLTPGASLTDWIAEATGPNPNQSYLEEVATTMFGKFDRSYIFGGPAAVSDQTWWQLDSQT